MFTLTSNIKISYDLSLEDSSLLYAKESFIRDLQKTLYESKEKEKEIVIREDKSLCDDAYSWKSEEGKLVIKAASSRAAAYALYKLSELALGVKPLWFFLDQSFSKEKERVLKEESYSSSKYAFRYRGWFINDEVLLSTWSINGDAELPYIMVFEALLRLGGNTIIPGTDRNGKRYRPLASSMGLIITHHHAEPLGSEMFSRVYPDEKASYLHNREHFESLWLSAIEEQKDMDVIWTLGFRGQGDVPFWENDPLYDSDEKRGALLSEVIKRQIEIIKSRVKSPILAVNIYGEMAALYKQGFVTLPDEVIRIWGDNGYGCMVSRRQGLDNPRTNALPEGSDRSRDNGMYYHASFYDLQAANHITPSTVSLDLIKSELDKAYKAKIDDLIIVNASNIRPHTLLLTALAEYWKSGVFSSDSYFTTYFDSSSRAIEVVKEYSSSTIKYSIHEDDKASDQFYTYVMRGLVKALMLQKESEESIYWYTDGSLKEQLSRLLKDLKAALVRYKELEKKAKNISPLFDATYLMYIRLYKMLVKANKAFAESGLLLLKKRYKDSFIKAGDSAFFFEQADKILNSGKGKWKNFYKNDCLTDVSASGSLMKAFMEFIRQAEDAPEYFKWQRYFTYSKEDKNVVLLTNFEKHMSGYEIYLKYRENRGKR